MNSVQETSLEPGNGNAACDEHQCHWYHNGSHAKELAKKHSEEHGHSTWATVYTTWEYSPLYP